MTPERHARALPLACAFVKLEPELRYPPLAGLVQYALESTWGERCSGDFNYWGIKSKAGQARKLCPTREFLTNEQFERLAPEVKQSVTKIGPAVNGKREYHLSDWFASYASAEDAVRGYVQFFIENQRYHKALAAYRVSGNVEEYLAGIADAGYATAPSYKSLLLRLARQKDLQDLIVEARNKVRG